MITIFLQEKEISLLTSGAISVGGFAVIALPPDQARDIALDRLAFPGETDTTDQPESLLDLGIGVAADFTPVVSGVKMGVETGGAVYHKTDQVIGDFFNRSGAGENSWYQMHRRLLDGQE